MASISRSTARAERYAREGVELSLSTLADQVGACAMVLKPLYEALRAHVFAAERIHGDDTPVPVLARARRGPGRLWTYVRDDRPFAGPAPPAAVFFYSPDRRGEHPERHLGGFAGILQADAYAGFNRLYDGGAGPARSPKQRAGRMAAASSSNWPTRRCAREAAIRRRARGGEADRRHLRHRARDQWSAGGGSARRAPTAHPAAGQRTRRLDAGRACPALPPCRSRKSLRLHADRWPAFTAS